MKPNPGSRLSLGHVTYKSRPLDHPSTAKAARAGLSLSKLRVRSLPSSAASRRQPEMFLPRHPSLPRGLVASSPVVPWFPAGSATAFLLSTRFLPSSSPWHLHRRRSCVPTPHRLDSIRRIPTASVSTRRRAVEVLHLPRQSRRRARRWRLGATQRKSAEVTPRERCLVTDSLVRHQLVLTRAGKRCTG